MIKKLSENILDKFSMDFLRSQVLKNAYGNIHIQSSSFILS